MLHVPPTVNAVLMHAVAIVAAAKDEAVGVRTAIQTGNVHGVPRTTTSPGPNATPKLPAELAKESMAHLLLLPASVSRVLLASIKMPTTTVRGSAWSKPGAKQANGCLELH